jgi:hypothetical protein
MKLTSLRNLKRIEAVVGIAYKLALIVLIFAPLPGLGPSRASSSAIVLTDGAGWLAA